MNAFNFSVNDPWFDQNKVEKITPRGELKRKGGEARNLRKKHG